jgi:hypothetical protein
MNRRILYTSRQRQRDVRKNLEYLEHAKITVIKFTAPMTLSFCDGSRSVPPSHWLVVGLIVAQSRVKMSLEYVWTIETRYVAIKRIYWHYIVFLKCSYLSI